MPKIYVGSADEQAAAKAALGLAAELVKDFKGQVDIDQEDVEQAKALEQFILTSNVVIGTAGSLDTALMAEIGKAYKEQYVNAKAAGDTTTENKMFGAMVAIKRIMDMVEAPKI